MALKDHLSKDEELRLGTLIQAGRAALERSKTATSPEELKELQTTIKIGEDAVEKLVKANLGLVYSQAHAFKKRMPSAPDVEDLIQDGMTGLMTAVGKYDPSRGNKFSTVAYYWIAQSIGRGTNKTSRLVRLPENRIADYTKMMRIISQYEGSSLSQEEIEQVVMEQLNLTMEEVVNIRNAARTHSSLNHRIGDDSDRELIDLVGEENAVGGADRIFSSSEGFRIIQEGMRGLDSLHREVVASHYSVPVGGEYFAPTEVRETYGLSQNKYRRILMEGLQELKKSFTSVGLTIEDFLEV